PTIDEDRDDGLALGAHSPHPAVVFLIVLKRGVDMLPVHTYAAPGLQLRTLAWIVAEVDGAHDRVSQVRYDPLAHPFALDHQPCLSVGAALHERKTDTVDI